MPTKRRKATRLLYNVLPFILSAILIFSLYFAVSGISRIATALSGKDKSPEQEISADHGEVSAVYIATVKDGRIIIVNADDYSIQRELNVWITVLPETDRLFLEEGIPLYSEREINELIAYYTS